VHGISNDLVGPEETQEEENDDCPPTASITLIEYHCIIVVDNVAWMTNTNRTPMAVLPIIPKADLAAAVIPGYDIELSSPLSLLWRQSQP
jgi:hypothetical protein